MFPRQRRAGHVETPEVAPSNVAPSALPTVAAKPPQFDSSPEAAEGPASIAPLDTIAAASPKTRVYRCIDC